MLRDSNEDTCDLSRVLHSFNNRVNTMVSGSGMSLYLSDSSQRDRLDVWYVVLYEGWEQRCYSYPL